MKGRKGAAVLPGDGGGGARKVQSSGAAVNLRASHRGGPLNPPLMDELLLVVLRRALLHPLDRRDRADVLRGLYTLITVTATVITSVYLDGLNAEFSCREFRFLPPRHFMMNVQFYVTIYSRNSC